jgi:uncharacterized membrane protein
MAAALFLARHSCAAAKWPAPQGVGIIGLVFALQACHAATQHGHQARQHPWSTTMLGNNSVTIIMIVMTYITLSAPVAYFFILAPRQLETRKQRNIAKLVSGAELLADAISRNGHDPVHLARLQAQYDAHARALTQLGSDVPALIDAPVLQQAA